MEGHSGVYRMMICIICDTEILRRDGFYWEYDKDTDEKIGPAHDDCLLREAEFSGEGIEAATIFKESAEFYKTLPKV